MANEMFVTTDVTTGELRALTTSEEALLRRMASEGWNPSDVRTEWRPPTATELSEMITKLANEMDAKGVFDIGTEGDEFIRLSRIRRRSVQGA